MDLHLCIICQKKKNENLVEKPEAYENVRLSIEEWSKYGNLQYTEAWNKLRFTSLQELKDGRASWHRSCTHRDNGGSGAGVLGHPPARKARRRVPKTPGPRTPRCPCV